MRSPYIPAEKREEEREEEERKEGKRESVLPRSRPLSSEKLPEISKSDATKGGFSQRKRETVREEKEKREEKVEKRRGKKEKGPKY